MAHIRDVINSFVQAGTILEGVPNVRKLLRIKGMTMIEHNPQTFCNIILKIKCLNDILKTTWRNLTLLGPDDIITYF
jgi:hypothetical protein